MVSPLACLAEEFKDQTLSYLSLDVVFADHFDELWQLASVKNELEAGNMERKVDRCI